MTRLRIARIVTPLFACFLSHGCEKNDRSQPKEANPPAKAGSAMAEEPQKPNPAETLARAACADVGLVTKSAAGSRGAPILLLEERHNSRAMQVEHAITLLRLYEQHALRDVGLEGYLKDDRTIETAWFTDASRDLSNSARARLCVRFLGEGEISSAEFLRLLYADLRVHPIEIRREYAVELDEKSAAAPLTYLVRLAEQSLQEEHVRKVKALQREAQGLNGEVLEKKIKEMLDYLLSVDPWIKEKKRQLEDTGAAAARSAEQQRQIVQEIADRAQNKRVTLDTESKDAMRRNIGFWDGRIKASNTMVQAACEIADQPATKVVAMIIGAAHTDEMCNLLQRAGRPYAVVTPKSLNDKDERGDLSWEMFDRKYKRLSVYSEGLSALLAPAFPSDSKKKPQPVLNEAWFEGKAELYGFTERIVRAVLGPPSPSGGGKPPYGFDDDDFKGKRVFIDPKRIQIIQDTPTGGRCVLFPVILNPDDPTKRREVWLKAGLTTALTEDLERESIEQMLRGLLEQLKGEETLNPKGEDAKGRVAITIDCIAAFSNTQDGARAVVLGI